MTAPVSGARLAEIRRHLGITQTQLAGAAGLSQARISQIESGAVTNLATLLAYVTGLGGHLDVVVRIGDLHLDVAGERARGCPATDPGQATAPGPALPPPTS
ncbi:helix-turn-helix domain-containing protein [Micromonospora yangpuensis]|uniref:Helix-turn-helix n=1 Tax=Micromonospora yangpuensis TaxID=683228 RepID=A0A1C6UBW3_9ACTN|nr:helix-turn-helix transcriptional regulator [Micromonospora yangpuensis]GGL86361.1 hypothetical protein GCM10012279_00060 [Micromonospora yangpuensis]SCL51536.1 Helix-turn-helix [Micromonospora yangpuensis]